MQESINKAILKFPEKKKESMLLDEDPFPPVPTINTVTFDQPSLLDAKRAAKAAHVQS